MASSHHTIKPEIHNGVSTLDEPSAAWGWHDIGKGAVQKAGWVSVLFLLLLNFGNHQGHVETIWLLSLAGIMAIALILHAFEPQLSQVRTVTAQNKPQGHVEPNWMADQAARTGVYAELTESQQRAWNWEPETRTAVEA